MARFQLTVHVPPASPAPDSGHPFGVPRDPYEAAYGAASSYAGSSSGARSAPRGSRWRQILIGLAALWLIAAFGQTILSSVTGAKAPANTTAGGQYPAASSAQERPRPFPPSEGAVEDAIRSYVAYWGLEFGKFVQLRAFGNGLGPEPLRVCVEFTYSYPPGAAPGTRDMVYTLFPDAADYSWRTLHLDSAPKDYPSFADCVSTYGPADPVDLGPGPLTSTPPSPAFSTSPSPAAPPTPTPQPTFNPSTAKPAIVTALKAWYQSANGSSASLGTIYQLKAWWSNGDLSICVDVGGTAGPHQVTSLGFRASADAGWSAPVISGGYGYSPSEFDLCVHDTASGTPITLGP